MTALRPRPGILDIEAYVPGRSTLPQAGRVIRLASNEGALGPSPKAVAAYQGAGADIFRYPDGSSTKLREAIGRRYGIDPALVVCGCGSGDVLHLLAQAYSGPGDEVIYSEHGFLLYPIAAHRIGAMPVVAPERDYTVSVDEILERAGERTRIVFVASPNNPTGTYLAKAELHRLREGLPEGVLLVVDGAYAEFADAPDYSIGDELVARGDTVTTRTFSKFHALAGVRLGWAHCPPDVADVLNRIRGPFNVSLPAQAAAVAALEDEEFQARALAHNTRWRAWITQELRALGLVVPESAANFILVLFPGEGGLSADAANDALNARGIIVRKLGSYGLPRGLRITIGTGEEMEAVRDALAGFMGGRR